LKSLSQRWFPDCAGETALRELNFQAVCEGRLTPAAEAPPMCLGCKRAVDNHRKRLAHQGLLVAKFARIIVEADIKLEQW
jgi:hypothetical protein